MNKKILIIGYSSFIKRRIIKPLKKINNLDIYICSKSQKITEKVKGSFDDYEVALKKRKYDFVYISLINKLHFKYSKLVLMKGYNLIIDKPITTSFKETQTLINLAKKKNVYLIEFIIFNYHAVFNKIIDIIGGINKISLIQSNFNIPLVKNIKTLNEIKGGCNYDMGSYAATMIRIFFREKYNIKFLYKKSFSGKYKKVIKEFILTVYSRTKTYFGNFSISKEYISNIIIFTEKKIAEIPFQAFALPSDKKITFSIKEKNKKKIFYLKDDYIMKIFKNILNKKFSKSFFMNLIEKDNMIKKKLNLIN